MKEQAAGTLTIPDIHAAAHEQTELMARSSSNEGFQAHSSNPPKLHFSNPHIEQIIKTVQNEMMMNSTMVKQLWSL